MKLLIYSHAFAPSVGGIETFVMSLAQGLARGKSGWQITVVTPTPGAGGDDAALPFRVVRRPRLMTLLAQIRQAEVIHLAGPAFLPMLLGLLLRKPILVEHSGYQAICPNGLLLDERTKTVCPGHFMAGRYRECLRCNAAAVSGAKSLAMVLLTFPRRWMCGKVARNVFPSNHVGNRIALPRGLCVYHGTPGPLPASPRGAKDDSAPPCLAFVGRLVREKGVDVLFAACRNLLAQGYDFRLQIMGDGPERASLETLAHRYGLCSRTVFTGSLEGEALSVALEGVSVAVVPSICEETAGLSAVELMMRGCCVVASDIGGLGEYVDGVGLKFTPGDIAELASCLKRVIEEPGLAETLGEKARKRALQMFREDRMVAEHLAVYDQLLAGSNPSPQVQSAVARPRPRS